MTGTNEWIEFVKAKGTIHIIADLGEESRRFSDLEDSVPVSTGTLSDRLKRGRELGAWEVDRILDDDGDRTVYRLARPGERVFDVLDEYDAIEASRKARRHRETIEEARQHLIERFSSIE